jgi:hypothetical protein
LAWRIKYQNDEDVLGKDNDMIADVIGLASVLIAGQAAIIGDCGFEKYPVTESGAAGYCYVQENDTVSIQIKVNNETIEQTPAVIVPAVVAESQHKVKHCNKGGGNGGEGCDSGNHPDKGNDDESPVIEEKSKDKKRP